MNNDKKKGAVIGLGGPDRYAHFIKVVADKRCVWGLWSGGWGLHQTNDDGSIVFPVWPEQNYAELSAIGEWEHFKAHKIDLDDFLDELIPRLRRDGYLITVFPIPGVGGVVPTLEVLEDDLRTELSRIE